MYSSHLGIILSAFPGPGNGWDSGRATDAGLLATSTGRGLLYGVVEEDVAQGKMRFLCKKMTHELVLYIIRFKSFKCDTLVKRSKQEVLGWGLGSWNKMWNEGTLVIETESKGKMLGIKIIGCWDKGAYWFKGTGLGQPRIIYYLS